jgi:hypothetical protein
MGNWTKSKLDHFESSLKLRMEKLLGYGRLLRHMVAKREASGFAEGFLSPNDLNSGNQEFFVFPKN